MHLSVPDQAELRFLLRKYVANAVGCDPREFYIHAPKQYPQSVLRPTYVFFLDRMGLNFKLASDELHNSKNTLYSTLRVTRYLLSGQVKAMVVPLLRTAIERTIEQINNPETTFTYPPLLEGFENIKLHFGNAHYKVKNPEDRFGLNGAKLTTKYGWINARGEIILKP